MGHIDDMLFPILDPATDYIALVAMAVIVVFGICEILSKFKVTRR